MGFQYRKCMLINMKKIIKSKLPFARKLILRYGKLYKLTIIYSKSNNGKFCVNQSK